MALEPREPKEPTEPLRTLLLLRHAATEDFRPGRRDRERELTAAGRAEAEAVGAWLRTAGLRVDQLLCSPAVRARQTAAALDLELAPDAVDYAEAIYDAGSDALLGLVRELPDRIGVALLVGHAPGVPRLAYELAGPDSDPAAVAGLERQFGTATLARITVTDPWPALVSGRLIELRTAQESR